MTPAVLAEPIEVVLEVGAALELLGVAWLVGGSVASSLYGMPRSTHGVDIVADLSGAHAEPFVAALTDRFYVDLDAVREAIRRRATFNLIHDATVTKVDVFVAAGDPLAQEELARRTRFPLSDGRSLPVATVEDMIVQKLSWFRRGGGVSERQWNDVLGMIRVCGGRVDWVYAEATASRLGVADLLTEARDGAG